MRHPGTTELRRGIRVATAWVDDHMAGSVIGPLIAGPLSDRMGRKPVLLGDYLVA